MTEFLGRKGFAHRMGWKNADSLRDYVLPPADAVIDGVDRGWLAETVDRFKADLPGRGFRGVNKYRRRRSPKDE